MAFIVIIIIMTSISYFRFMFLTQHISPFSSRFQYLSMINMLMTVAAVFGGMLVGTWIKG